MNAFLKWQDEKYRLKKGKTDKDYEERTANIFKKEDYDKDGIITSEEFHRPKELLKKSKSTEQKDEL